MKNWVIDLMKGSETRARKDLEERSGISRREFLAGALAAGAGAVMIPNIVGDPKAYAGSLKSTASRLMPDYATATAFQGRWSQPSQINSPLTLAMVRRSILSLSIHNLSCGDLGHFAVDYRQLVTI